MRFGLTIVVINIGKYHIIEIGRITRRRVPREKRRGGVIM